MATQLNLEEQEQLDAVRHFWRRWGGWITGVLLVVLLAVVGWQGWQWWQRDQAVKASALFDQLDAAANVNDAARVERAFADLRERHARTAFAQQGALIAARVQANAGKLDEAAATLGWAAGQAIENEYRTVARLRLAALLIEQKKPQDALAQLDQATAPGFEALVLDRRGDVLAALGKAEEAKAAWQQAHARMDRKVEYRRLIAAKLAAVGAPPPADPPEPGDPAADGAGAAR